MKTSQWHHLPGRQDIQGGFPGKSHGQQHLQRGRIQVDSARGRAHGQPPAQLGNQGAGLETAHPGEFFHRFELVVLSHIRRIQAQIVGAFGPVKTRVAPLGAPVQNGIHHDADLGFRKAQQGKKVLQQRLRGHVEPDLAAFVADPDLHHAIRQFQHMRLLVSLPPGAGIPLGLGGKDAWSAHLRFLGRHQFSQGIINPGLGQPLALMGFPEITGQLEFGTPFLGPAQNQNADQRQDQDDQKEHRTFLPGGHGLGLRKIWRHP